MSPKQTSRNHERGSRVVDICLVYSWCVVDIWFCALSVSDWYPYLCVVQILIPTWLVLLVYGYMVCTWLVCTWCVVVS